MIVRIRIPYRVVIEEMSMRRVSSLVDRPRENDDVVAAVGHAVSVELEL